MRFRTRFRLTLVDYGDVVFLVDDQGNYLIDDKGNYLIEG